MHRSAESTVRCWDSRCIAGYDRSGLGMTGNLGRKERHRADRGMKIRAYAWLAVFFTATFQCLRFVAAQQPGFLSLDCGASKPLGIDYFGISWVPDDTYISGGKTATVSNNYTYESSTLRYFPDTTRTRYCYNLPTTVGQRYLLRTTYFHGDYDTHPIVKFDVALDVFQLKFTLSFTAASKYGWREILFQAFKDNVQLCLLRTSPTDNPFISSVELRPLDDTMYATVATGSALLLQIRSNLGNGSFLRYPDDKYDRYWVAESSSTLVNITSNSVMDSGYAVDKPPFAVMRTAVTLLATDPDPNMQYAVIPTTGHNNAYLINIFLAELQTSQSRLFNILVNGEVVESDVNVYTSALYALYEPIEISNNMSTVGATGLLNITLAKASLSLLPPIWNALEVYSVHSKSAGTLASDVTAIERLKKAFGLGALWTGDPCLQVPYDWLTCSVESPARVTAVKLSSANLSGPIPDLRTLTSLTTLHLDNNSLTGEIPDWLASLPNLQELYLQNNDLSGNVPKALLNLKSVRLEGNPNLCVNTTCASSKKKSSSLGLIIGVVVGVLLLVGIATGVVVYVCCRRSAKKMEPNSLPVSEIAIGEGTTNRGSRYTEAQVMTATKNYAKLLGRGGFGPVYYGKLASGQEVAVKVAAKGSGQGSKEFINEVELLTRVHHKNLVSLVGYCDEGHNLILLYEYMALGTVQSHLYGVGEQKKEFLLDWKTRLQIALNSAQGLEYLHVGCQPVIFHRDVKSNNILLDDKLTAKVADFGLSKSSDSKGNVTHMSTMVKGTIGYLDPEYFSSNQLTDKSDVYGFGIVLLELICARPPLVPELPEDQRRIDQWVRPHLQAGTIEEIVDPLLGNQYNLDAMWKVADLAMQSVEPKGKHRPNMSTIVQELRAAVEMENPDSSSNFRFDIPYSSASVSDPNYMASTTINAR